MNSERDLADVLEALDQELERRVRQGPPDAETRAETIGLLTGLIAGLVMTGAPR